MKRVKFIDPEGYICKGTLVHLDCGTFVRCDCCDSYFELNEDCTILSEEGRVTLIKFTIQNGQEHYGILYNDIIILLENGDTIPKDKVKILDTFNEWFPALEAFVEENFDYLKD